MLVCHAVVRHLLIEVADCRDVKEVQVVSEGNPEETIVFVLQVHLLFCLLSPFITLIAPGTLPLFLAPRVPDLDQSFGFSVVKRDHFRPDETVGVGVDQAYRLDLLRAQIFICLTGDSCAHWELLLVRVQNLIPELIWFLQVCMEEELVRAARKWVHGLASSACLDALVTAEDFRPDFLKYEDPDLGDTIFTRWPREGPLLRVWVVREVVVDDHRALLAIDVDRDSVAAGFVDFVSQENFLDPVRKLSK